MGALLGFAFSPLGRWFVGGLALLVVAGGLYFKIYSDGAASEKARQDRESLNNLRNRAETNDTVEKLPTPDLDGELDRWMLPDDR